MPSDIWLASCHRRTLGTMRRKAVEMAKQWEGANQEVSNELLWLIDCLENSEELLYFFSKNEGRVNSSERKK